MNITQQLTIEHHDVKEMLHILMNIAARIEQTKELNAEHFANILEFLKNFVDKCHHGKEEQALFPALEKAGMSSKEGILSYIFPEHDQGRKYVHEMKEAFEGYKKGDSSALLKITEAIYFYSRLLQHHIDQEEQHLFPMAEKMLTDEVKYNLYKQFEDIEERVTGPGVHEKYEELIKDLSQIYAETAESE